MTRNFKLKVAGIGLLVAAPLSMAHAQAGPCRDPWINQAFHELYNRAPAGSVGSGECDITRYGNGHWTTYADLKSKIVQHNGAARSAPVAPISTRLNPSQPAIGVALAPSAGARNGSGLISDAGANIISQDGGGLVGGSGGTMRSVQTVDKPRAPAGKYLVIPGGSLVDANGNVVRSAGTYTVVVRNGVNAIGTGGHAPVAGTILVP